MFFFVDDHLWIIKLHHNNQFHRYNVHLKNLITNHYRGKADLYAYLKCNMQLVLNIAHRQLKSILSNPQINS